MGRGRLPSSARKPGEGVAEFPNLFLNPLTLTLSPMGRGEVHRGGQGDGVICFRRRGALLTLPLVGRVASNASRVGVEAMVEELLRPPPRHSLRSRRPSPQGGGKGRQGDSEFSRHAWVGFHSSLPGLTRQSMMTFGVRCQAAWITGSRRSVAPQPARRPGDDGRVSPAMTN